MSGLASDGTLSPPTWATRLLDAAKPSDPVDFTSRAFPAMTIPNTNVPTATAASGAAGRRKAPGPAPKRRGARPRRARKRMTAAIRNACTTITSSAAIAIATQYAVRMSSAFGE